MVAMESRAESVSSTRVLAVVVALTSRLAALRPIFTALAPLMPNTSCSPALAPIWMEAINPPCSKTRLLYSMPVAIRLISATSSSISLLKAVRSEVEWVLEVASEAMSRMDCRALVVSSRAESATWAMDMPTLALVLATFSPRICAVRRVLMPMAAAPSLAELTRRPEARR